jgi:hypothetical protein
VFPKLGTGSSLSLLVTFPYFHFSHSVFYFIQKADEETFKTLAPGKPMPPLPNPTHYSDLPSKSYERFSKNQAENRSVHAFNDLRSAPCRRVTVGDLIGHLPPPPSNQRRVSIPLWCLIS